MSAVYRLTAIAEQDVVDVARAVWGDMLGLTLDGPDPTAALPAGPVLCATVVIRAALDVVVALEVAEDAGRSLAAAMFGSEPGDLGPDELVDALGELANMVGGNLKLLVAPPAALTLPAVSDGELPPQVGTRQQLRVPLRFADGVLHLVVRLTEPGTAAVTAGTERPSGGSSTGNPSTGSPVAGDPSTSESTTDRSVA